jgi:hypothetical protein
MIFPECSENKRDTLPRVRYDAGSEFKTGMSRIKSAAFSGLCEEIKIKYFWTTTSLQENSVPCRHNPNHVDSLCRFKIV